MMAHQALIGVLTNSFRFPDCPGFALPEKYVRFIRRDMGMPLLIPVSEEPSDASALAQRLDGLLLTGSPTNVEPYHYGGSPSVSGTLHDPKRDATVLPLIRAAIKEKVPILALCRGMQELNVALGGTLLQRVHELPGRLDHRAPSGSSFDERHGIAHTVELRAGGTLEALLGRNIIEVNSLHAQAIDRVAPGLVVEGVAPDGTIEAVAVDHPRTFALGVQWHPEWPNIDDPISKALRDCFATACLRRVAER